MNVCGVFLDDCRVSMAMLVYKFNTRISIDIHIDKPSLILEIVYS